ncbi:MAG: hypothetical protein J2P19_29275, partial [Pseudonocardia sp.]|nr:hypothetical protein [Pseudonocardia sp.]
ADDPEGCTGAGLVALVGRARQACRGFVEPGEGVGMAKHRESPDESEGDGQTELDEIELAELLKEQGGQHSADDEE